MTATATASDYSAKTAALAKSAGPPNSTRYYYEVPQPAWEALRDALARTSGVSSDDLHDHATAVRAALSAGLSAVAELIHLREVCESMRRAHPGCEVPPQLEPKLYFDIEDVGEFATAGTMLDSLLHTCRCAVEACTAMALAREARP